MCVSWAGRSQLPCWRLTIRNWQKKGIEKNYRDKGIRTTTIKTVYGEVSYGRHVYQTKLEDGKKAYVYLLDEAMRMERSASDFHKSGRKVAMTVTEAPYRVTAETISSTYGQSISAGGVWNVMQRLGERISKEEEHAVKQMRAGSSQKEKRKSQYCLRNGWRMAFHAGCTS